MPETQEQYLDDTGLVIYEASIKTRLDKKVDSIDGSGLIDSDSLAQIAQNKTDIQNLKTDKADQESLESLQADVNKKAEQSYVDEKLKEKANQTDIENALADKADSSQLANYLLSSDAELNYAKKSELNSKVNTKEGYDLVSESDVTQITTNKDNISSLQTSLGSIQETIQTLQSKLQALETEVTGADASLTEINSRLEGMV